MDENRYDVPEDAPIKMEAVDMCFEQIVDPNETYTYTEPVSATDGLAYPNAEAGRENAALDIVTKDEPDICNAPLELSTDNTNNNRDPGHFNNAAESGSVYGHLQSSSFSSEDVLQDRPLEVNHPRPSHSKNWSTKYAHVRQECSENTGPSKSAPNPWPYLEPLYNFVDGYKRHGNKRNMLVFQCMLCNVAGNKRHFKADSSSRTNLKWHIMRNHPSYMSQWLSLLGTVPAKPAHLCLPSSKHDAPPGPSSVSKPVPTRPKQSTRTKRFTRTKRLTGKSGTQCTSSDTSLASSLSSRERASETSSPKLASLRSRTSRPASSKSDSSESEMYDLMAARSVLSNPPLQELQFSNSPAPESAPSRHVPVANEDSSTSEEAFKRSLVCYLICCMKPPRTIGLSSFRGMWSGILTDYELPSEQQMDRLIEKEYHEKKSALIGRLAAQESVGITVDCWTTLSRVFLGVTVEWIDCETLEKTVALLSCRQFTTQLTSASVELALKEIYQEFGIDNKVVSTTVDCFSSFIDSLEYFEKESMREKIVEGNGLRCAPPTEKQTFHKLATDFSKECSETRDVYSLLVTESRPGGLPSRYIKCAASQLSMIGSVDLKDYLLHCCDEWEAERDDLSEALRRAASIWSLHSTNLMVQTILNVPSVNCWTSVYECLTTLVNLDPGKLERALVNQDSDGEDPAYDDILPLNTRELALLRVYTQVLGPIVKSLSFLQDETDKYLGEMLPVIYLTIYRLKRVRSSCEKSTSLCYKSRLFFVCVCDMLIKKVKDRFKNVLESDSLALASAFHPSHNALWLGLSVEFDDDRLKDAKKRLLERMVSKLEQYDDGGSPRTRTKHCANATPYSINDNDDDNDDDADDDVLFCPQTSSSASAKFVKEESRLITFLTMATTAKGKEWIRSNEKKVAFPSITYVKAFANTNTGTPSNAVLKRFFYLQSGEILSMRAAVMSAITFEHLSFLRAEYVSLNME